MLSLDRFKEFLKSSKPCEATSAAPHQRISPAACGRDGLVGRPSELAPRIAAVAAFTGSFCVPCAPPSGPQGLTQSTLGRVSD